MGYQHKSIPPAQWHGSRISSGLDADKGTPEVIGQLYEGSDTLITYIARGTSSPADWKAIYRRPTAKGQLAVALGADDFGFTPAPPGNGFVPVSDSGQASGYQFQALSSIGTATSCKVEGLFTDPIASGVGDVKAVFWNTEVFDTGGYWSTANRTRFTVSTAGKYRLTFLFKCGVSSSAGRFEFRKNGTTFLGPVRQYIPPSSSLDEERAYNHCAPLMDIFDLVPSDYIEIVCTNIASGSTNGVGVPSRYWTALFESL